MDSLPYPTRPVSLADVTSEPLPRQLKLVALAIVIVALAGAAYFLFLRGGKTGAVKQGVITLPVPVADRETRLKAALHDLENGKTCADRKAAIPTLIQVGDERAIAALKKARHRMRGGVLGIGDNNTNACLKADAESAIQALGGSLR